MKSKIFKIIALALCVVSICMCFTGCGGEEDNGPVIELTPEEIALRDGTLVKPSQNEEYKYNIYTTYIELTKYLGDGGEIVIPETIEDKPVYSIAGGCYGGNHGITSVEMKDNIWRIGAGAFDGCVNLVNVKLSNNLKELPKKSFANCNRLTFPEIPASLDYIREDTFRNCGSFDKILIPGTVQIIEKDAFYGCTGISEIIIKHGDVVDAEGYLVEENKMIIYFNAFSKITNCKKIIVPDSVIDVTARSFSDAPADCVFYGYVPSKICTMAAESRLTFIEIVEGDEIDVLIRVRPTKVKEETTEAK